MPTNKSKYNPAFTLAEVLVTLAIIGVVASLTIPSLMKNYQETVWKIAWKREFSVLNQAMKMAVADNDGSIIGAFSSHATLRGLFLAHLKYTRTCSNPQNGVCWPYPSYELNGDEGWETATSDMSSAILTNGTTIKVVYRSIDCTNAGFIANNCGFINIDVNGLKGPNTMGKDIYSIAIFKDRLVPLGAEPINSTTNPAITCVDGSTAATNTGSGCAAKYLYN